MKIKVTKRKCSVSIRIHAARRGQEGTDLKDAVLSCMAKDGQPADTAVAIVRHLGELGYRGDPKLKQKSKNVEAELSK